MNLNVGATHTCRTLFNRAAAGGRDSSFIRFFFLVLSVTRRRPPLSQMLVGTLNHETCNVLSPKAFETLIHENVTHIGFFIVCEIYFLLVLLKFSHVRTCKDYVIGRGITIVLKIAVESVTLELCDSRDHFASPLLVKKTD